MSGGRGNGVAHQVLDRLARFEAAWSTKQNELIKRHNDLAAQNQALEQLVKQVAGFTAAELGKFQGTSQQHIMQLGRSVSGLDVNVLALAEIVKEIIGQLTQVDAIFKKTHSATKDMLSNMYGALNDDGQAKQLTPEMISEFKNALEMSETEVADIKTQAETWFKDLVSSSFTKVRERIEAQEKAQAEQEAKEAAAKAEAEAVAAKAAEAATEKETVEGELKAAAEAERTIVTNKSGGPGTSFPDGADIFGG